MSDASAETQPSPPDDAPTDDAPTDDAPTEAAEAGAGRPELHGCPVVDSLGAAVVHCERDAYLELMTALKGDGYAMLSGVSGVDYLTHPGRDLPDGIGGQRFEVVVELVRVRDRHRLRVRCQVPADDASLPSLFDLWMGAEAHEREVYDMFGLSFVGHPDPSRILMPEDWEGHPLRKDYASGRVPVQFKESPGGR